MPDPIEELSNFEPGVPVNPMPAAEVRRRGERLRRRNTALVVGGAVAAVILVAAPIAVFAGDDKGSEPQPAPAPSLSTDALLTADEVPARGRLTPWEEIPEEGKTLACAPAPPAALDAEFSERRDFGADVAEGPAGDVPVSVVRTEVLQFADEATAKQEYEQAQGWILGCPGGAKLANKGVKLVTAEMSDGQGEWRRHDFFAPDICTECGAIRFDRMGIAQFGDRIVLVSLAEVGGPLQPEGLDASMDALFAAAVSTAGGEISAYQESNTGDPELVEPSPGELDFPIETGLPAEGSDSTVEGPGADVEGVTLPEQYCGTEHWPATSSVGRLAVKVSGPEYGLWRELVTFESEDEAVAVLAGLRSALEECPAVAGDSAANDMTFVSHDVDSGYDDATFSYTYREGLGGVVYQFVRVGHAVLATAQSGEWSPETTVPGARELNGENQQLTALMCEYTEAGC